MRAAWLVLRWWRDGGLWVPRAPSLAEARAIACSERFAGLHRLRLMSLPEAGACRQLFTGDNFARLEELVVDQRAMQAARSRGDAVRAAPAPDASYLGEAIGGCLMRDLRTLEISSCWIGDRGAAGLAASSNHTILRKLGLHRAGIGDDGLRAITSGPWHETLEQLELTHGRVAGVGLEALGRLSELQHLSFVGCPMGDDAVEALATVSLPKLRVLHLDHTRVGERGAVALGRAQRAWPSLQCLYLGGTVAAVKGRRALAASGWLSASGDSGFITWAGRAEDAETERFMGALRAL